MYSNDRYIYVVDTLMEGCGWSTVHARELLSALSGKTLQPLRSLLSSPSLIEGGGDGDVGGEGGLVGGVVGGVAGSGSGGGEGKETAREKQEKRAGGGKKKGKKKGKRKS